MLQMKASWSVSANFSRVHSAFY